MWFGKVWEHGAGQVKLGHTSLIAFFSGAVLQRHGEARSVMARHGEARHGKVRQGKGCIFITPFL